MTPTDLRPLVLVTGASGFVGRAIVPNLLARGYAVRPAVRSARFAFPGAEDTVSVGEIGPDTDWRGALAGVRHVVHLAARVHQMDTGDPQRESAYWPVNVGGTEALATAAAAAGVQRFVFVSTAKVYGESLTAASFDHHAAPAPQGEYAVSKLEAERVLARLAKQRRLEPVVLRPPMIYGPGVKANFLALFKAVARGIPLPLAGVRNRRSILYVENLAALIAHCIAHPRAAGRSLPVADEPSMSTPDLVRAMGEALGRPARLIPFPPELLRLGGVLLARRAAVERLLGDFELDCSATWLQLQWRPPKRTDEGLLETARWYQGR